MDPLLVITPGRSGGSGLVGALKTARSIYVDSTFPYEDRWACEALSYKCLEPKTQENFFASVSQATLKGEGAIHLLRTRIGEHYGGKTVHLRPRPAFFVEKAHYFLRNAMLQVFPKTLTVLLVRDPRDAMRSALKFFPSRRANHAFFRGREGKLKNLLASGFGVFFSRFEELLRLYRAAGGRILTVRYEDMVRRPESILEPILKEVGPQDPDCLERAVRRFHQTAKFDRHSTTQSPGKSMGAWRTFFSDEEQVLLNTTFRQTLSVMGYDPV